MEGRRTLELLSPAEAAAILGVAEETLSQWRYRRCGPPFIRVGRRFVRYPADELASWLAAHRVDPAREGQG